MISRRLTLIVTVAFPDLLPLKEGNLGGHAAVYTTSARRGGLAARMNSIPMKHATANTRNAMT